MFGDLHPTGHNEVRKRWGNIEATDFAVSSIPSWPSAKDSHTSSHGSTVAAGRRSRPGSSEAPLPRSNEAKGSDTTERLNRMRQRLLDASSTSLQSSAAGLCTADATWNKYRTSSSKSPPHVSTDSIRASSSRTPAHANAQDIRPSSSTSQLHASADGIRASSSRSPPHASTGDTKASSKKSPLHASTDGIRSSSSKSPRHASTDGIRSSSSSNLLERIWSRASPGWRTVAVPNATSVERSRDRVMADGDRCTRFRARVGDDVVPEWADRRGVGETDAESSGRPTARGKVSLTRSGATDGTLRGRVARATRAQPYAAVFSSLVHRIRAKEPASQVQKEHARFETTSDPMYSASPSLCPRKFLDDASHLHNERGATGSSLSRHPLTSFSSPLVESATSVEQLLHKKPSTSDAPVRAWNVRDGASTAARQADESRWKRLVDKHNGMPTATMRSHGPIAQCDSDHCEEEALAQYANALSSTHQYTSSLVKDQAPHRHIQMGNSDETPERRLKRDDLTAPQLASKMQVPRHVFPSPTSGGPFAAIREKAMHERTDAPSPTLDDIRVPQLRSPSSIPRAYLIKVTSSDLQHMASSDSALSFLCEANMDDGSHSTSDIEVMFVKKDGRKHVGPPTSVERAAAVNCTLAAWPRRSSLPPSEIPRPPSVHDFLHSSAKTTQKSDASNAPTPNIISSLSEEQHAYPIRVHHRSNSYALSTTFTEAALERVFRGWMNSICWKTARSARGIELWKLRNAERKQRRILTRWHDVALVQAQHDVHRSVKIIAYQVKQATINAVYTWKQVVLLRKGDLRKRVLVERRIQLRFFHSWHIAFRGSCATHDYHHRLVAAFFYHWQRTLRDWRARAFEKLSIRAVQRMKIIFHMWRAVHFFGVKGKKQALERMRVRASASLRVRARFHDATVALLRRRCRRAVRRWHVYTSRHKSITVSHIITNAIRGWVAYTVRRQLFRQKWSFNVVPFQVRWTIRRWGTCARKSVRRKHCIKGAICFSTRKLQGRVLKLWRLVVLAHTRVRQLLCKWNRDVLLPKLFNLWCIGHRVHKQQQRQMLGAVIHNARFVRRRSFTCWSHLVVHVCRPRRDRAERVESRRRCGLRAHAIAAWVAACALVHVKRRRNMVARERWQNAVVKRVWYGWRARWVRGLHTATQERTMYDKERTTHKELAKRVLCELRKVLSKNRTRVSKVARVVQLLGHRTQQIVFFAWRDCVRCMKHEGLRSAMAEHFLSQWTYMRVMQKWNAWVQEKFVATEVDRDVRYRIHVLRWRRLFWCWKEAYAARVLLSKRDHKRALGCARRWFLYQRSVVRADTARHDVENHRRVKMMKGWRTAYRTQVFRLHMEGTWFRCVLRAWQQVASSNANRREICVETLVRSREQARAHNVFSHWVCYILELQDVCRTKCRDWRLTTVLRVWKQKVAQEKRLSSTSLAQFNAHCANSAHTVLLEWLCATREGKIERQRCLQELGQLAAHRILEHAFRTWVEEAIKCKQIRTIDDLVQCQREKLLRSRVFCHWHERVVRCRTFRLSLLPGLMRRSWQAWCFWLQHEKTLAAITYKLTAARRMRAWTMWCQTLERARFLEGVFSTKFRLLDPKRYLSAWRKWVLQKTLSTRLDRILINKVREGRLRRHVAKWSATHATTRKLRCIDIFSVNRFYLRLAQKKLEVWKRATRTGSIDRAICHVTMRIRFGAWKAVVFASMWEKLRAQSAFRKWYECVYYRHLSARFYRRLRSALLASSWHRWVEVHCAAREQHARLLDLLRCFVADTDVMLVQRAWQVWYRQRDERRRIASCQLEVEKKSLSHRLQRWHRHARVRHVHARILFAALDTFAAAVLSRTFAAWRHCHRTSSSVHRRDRSCVRSMLSTRQRRLLRCWHRVWYVRTAMCLFITNALRAHATKILHDWQRVAASTVRQRCYITQKRDAEIQFLCDGIIRAWRGYMYAVRWIQSMTRLNIRRLHKWFVAWRVDVQARAAVRTHIRRWHTECVRIRNARASAHRYFVQHCVNVQRVCLRALILYHTHKRDVRVRCAECAMVVRQKRTQRALQWWRRDARLTWLLNNVACSWGIVSTHSLIRAWREETERHIRLRACATQLRATHVVSVMFLFFTAWAQRRALIRRTSEVAEHVIAQQYVRQRRKWFRAWFAGLMLERQFSDARAVREVGASRQVYTAWKDVIHAKRALRNLVEKARWNIRFRRKRSAIQRWHATWHHNLELKNKIIFYLLRSNRDAAQAVLASWRSRVDALRNERKHHKIISERVRQRIRALRFNVWQKLEISQRYKRRNIARAVLGQLQNAFDAWRCFRSTCIAAKHSHHTMIRLQRKVLLRWSKVFRIEKMGASRMGTALRRPALRSLGLFMGKLEMVCECATELGRVLQTWKLHVQQQTKLRKIMRAVDECRDELLVCKSVQGWQTLTQCTLCCRAVFHEWRRLVAAARLANTLAAFDAKYTQDWWITRFGSHGAVKNILREFHDMYNENNEHDASRVPVEVVSGLCWQRRQLYIGFARLQQRTCPEWENTYAEWPFWELSPPMGSRIHIATLRMLDVRMDTFKEFQEQRSLEALFDYCYQHPNQGDGSQDGPPLASTLCDLILVTLAAGRQPDQGTCAVVNGSQGVPKLHSHTVYKTNTRDGVLVATS